jgi:hypothetical protein
MPVNVAFAARCLGDAGDVQDLPHGQSLLREVAQAIAESAPRRGKEAQSFVEIALKAFASLAPLVGALATVQEAIDHLNQAKGVAARIAAWQMGFALRSRKERLSYALAALSDAEEIVRRGAISALEREWPGRADIIPVLTGVARNDRVSRVRQAALAAMQRSWPNEPTILDAIGCRADEETAHTHVIWLIEYLAKSWCGNPKAWDIVLKLAGQAGQKAKAADYSKFAVLRAAHRALVRGWRNDQRTLPFLINEAMRTSERLAASSARRSIGEGWRNDPQVLGFLQNRPRSDPEAVARAVTLRILGEGWRNDLNILAFLQHRATSDPEPLPRAAALQVIGDGWRNDPRVPALLQDRATNDHEPLPRAAALFGIQWRSRPQLLAFLQDRAKSDPEPLPRAAALLGVRWRGDPKLLTFLQDRAKSDPEPAVRAASLAAIMRTQRHPVLFWRERFFSPDISPTFFVRDLLNSVVGRAISGESIEIQRLLFAFLQDRAANDPEATVRMSAERAIARLNRDHSTNADPKSD